MINSPASPAMSLGLMILRLRSGMKIKTCLSILASRAGVHKILIQIGGYIEYLVMQPVMNENGNGN